MATVWVATLFDEMNISVQVTATREDAIAWLASQVSQEHWERFYDSLPPGERAGLYRQVADVDPLTVIVTYAGVDEENPAGESGDGSWGNDMYWMSIEQQQVWSAGM